MIECEMCKKWFPADEIETCPECGLELCPSCYDEHVTGCTLQMEKDVDDVIETSIPTICPECGSPLTLDPDPDGSARVYCENCDFCQELDEEQIAELDNGETEEDSDYDEFGNYLGDDAFTCLIAEELLRRTIIEMVTQETVFVVYALQNTNI